MYEALVELGFRPHDIFLLVTCPIAGLFGTLARTGMLTPLEKPPEYPIDVKPFSWIYVYRQITWSLGWAALSFVSGLVVGLLFVAIEKNAGSIARVLAVAIFAGYSAPALWKQQEKLIVDIIDQKLRALTK
jgi:hypothetical protein